MSLIRWQPLKELEALRHQINHLFDELTHNNRQFDQFSQLENALWAPAIELRETDQALILKATIPGIEAKELDVQVSENAVSIAGEHREETRKEEKGYFRSELQYGQFQRTVPLPVSVKHEQVQSTFQNGILTLTLPKAEPLRPSVTKVDLTMQAKAREATTGQRQHHEHLEDNAHTRAVEAVKASGSDDLSEETRELTAEQRLHNTHLEATTHQRAADAVNQLLSS